LLVAITVLTACAARDEPRAAAADPTLVYLAGDGELTVVDVAAGTSRTVALPARFGGDPPYRIVRAGGRLVLWAGSAVYTVDLELRSLPTKLADAWFFLPSAAPGRVWLALLDRESPETARRLRAVREVTVDGNVTVSDVAPPEGRWPAAAVDGALVFEKDGVLEVWDPSTRTVTRVLRGEAPAVGFGTLLPWCSGDYETLHVTDVRTGQDVAVSAPPRYATFDCWSAAFSPDGSLLAVPLAEASGARALALVDLDRRAVRVVEGSRVDEGYVFVAWASDGDSVFISGGERFEARTLVPYRIGSERAAAVTVPAVDFYGLAAG